MMTDFTHFSSDDYRHRLYEAIKDRRVPLKYAYIGEGAYIHDAFAQHQGYHSVIGGAQLEVDTALLGLDDSQTLCISDLGPGNAYHTIGFLEGVGQAGLRVDKYLGLDFSASLLSLAQSRIQEKFPQLQLTTAHWDFEDAPTSEILNWRRPSTPVVVTFLGHTLGNVSDPVRVLQNVRSSCRHADWLLVSVALFGDLSDKEIVEPYNQQAFHRAATYPLSIAGIDLAKGQFTVRFCQEARTVIGEFVFSSSFQWNQERHVVSFCEGDRIICFTSRRFVESEIIHMLDTCGWNIAATRQDGNHSHLAVLCSGR
jgi:SAM-dependent methyltransferase